MFGTVHHSTAQQLTKHFIDSLGAAMDTNYMKKGRDAMYIVDGVQIAGRAVDSVLSKRRLVDLLSLNFIKPTVKPKDFYMEINDAVVILSYVSQMKPAPLRREWRELKHRFHNIDEQASDTATKLIINGVTIPPQDIRSRIKAIRLRHLRYIDYGHRVSVMTLIGPDVNRPVYRVWTKN
jgi:hypothetical protein